MKKLVALVLAVMLFTGVAASLAEELLPGYYTPPKMTEGQYPIKQEGVTLTYWAPFDGTAPKFISTLAENDGYIQAMADTGVTLEFTHPIQGSEIDQFNLMLNSGNLPDMIQMSGESWYNGGLRAMYEDGIIVDCKFNTFGCGSAIATSSMATELIKGKKVEEALELSNKAVVEALDGLPAHKLHCSVLAEQAVRAAVKDYYEKNGIEYNAEEFQVCDCDHCADE